MIEKSKSCAFTGYRPEKLPWQVDEEHPRAQALKEKIFDVVEALYQSGIRHYICGMARGADFYFAEAVLRLQEEQKTVTLEAAIPYIKQMKAWPQEEQNRYFRLLSCCDVQTVLAEEYSRTCMKERNYYMVDQAAVLVAVYDGKFGGTMQTVNYARKSGLEVVQIVP